MSGVRCPYVIMGSAMNIESHGAAYVNDVVLNVLMGAKRATKFISPKHVVAGSRRRKRSKRERYVDVVVKIGAPNFRERAFIRACQKSGEPFPVKKVQLKWFK